MKKGQIFVTPPKISQPIITVSDQIV